MRCGGTVFCIFYSNLQTSAYPRFPSTMFLQALRSLLLLSVVGCFCYAARQKRVVWLGVKYHKKALTFPATTTPAVTTVAPLTTSTALPSAPHLCSADFVPDLLVQTADGNTYAFAGDVYWHILDFSGNVIDNRQNPGSNISKDWLNLPTNIDSAMTLSDGTTLLFKGDRFFIYWNKMPREPSTAPIAAVFPQVPAQTIDAAFVTNSSLVFVQGENFYVYGIEQFPFVQRGNIVDMGLPLLPVEAAVNLSDGLAYIIMDKTVYQVDTLTLQVTSTFPTQSFYGCLEPLMINQRSMIVPYGRKFDKTQDNFLAQALMSLDVL